MYNAGKEEYLRPSEHIGLDWICSLLGMLSRYTVTVLEVSAVRRAMQPMGMVRAFL